MKIYIGNENIYSPLGQTAKENFAKVCTDQTGVKQVSQSGFNKEDLFLAQFFNAKTSFLKVLEAGILASEIPTNIWQSPKTKIILSTTKGDIDAGISGAMLRAFNAIQNICKSVHPPLLISTACISGVVAITKAAELIQSQAFDNVIVIGCDVVSQFVVNGFQALYAMSEQPCMPFDASRTGINLGEACATVLLSNSMDSFTEMPLEYLGGSSTNDANHISGPSRTGEGLYRSIAKTIKNSGVIVDDIGCINAHGTATRFNDDMESIAFTRLGLNNTPLNSLKGYFGHTLGAAGVVETALAMQALREQTLVGTKGFSELGTSEPINVIASTRKSTFDCFLKTASGFGGGNASLIIKKI